MIRAKTPQSLSEALAFLAENPDLVPVAGCTDLMVSQPEARALPAAVIDLLRVGEIRGISDRDGPCEIGATTCFSEIRRSRTIQTHYPSLAAAAAVIGGWQIQNRATLGGNLANASPAGDSLPVLLALDAVIVAASAGGVREIPHSSFHVGYRRTALRPGEIITSIRLPGPVRDSIQLFKKVGTREAQAISKIMVSFVARREDGCLRDVRFAAGSVAEVPIRLELTERVCESRHPDAETAERAAEAAMAEVHPIDDVRSTAEYRRFALGRVVRRLVLEAGQYRPPIAAVGTIP